VHLTSAPGWTLQVQRFCRWLGGGIVDACCNWRWFLAFGCAVAIAAWMKVADAADIEVPPTSPDAAYAPVTYIDPYRFDVRFGAFAHGVGGAEHNTADINAEFVFPRLPFGQTDWWNVAMPRPHFGGLGNVWGRTSAAYVGALWTVPLSTRFFGEAFVDGAVHDGSLNGGSEQAALGCRALFHAGASLGYAITPEWSAMVTFDHLSNGKSLFGTPCHSNQGLNDYGFRIGYSF
jgi:lipid A 3-O-deacylase